VNVLSLFSGIGGLELGLERAGMTTVGQVEIDPFCRRVLAKHWPEVPRHDDVRTCVEWWGSGPRPAVHVVAGGFPCQPFSKAGRRQGVADERWGWPWFAGVVRALRPPVVVVENVAALLGDSDAFGCVLGDLAACGYDADWDCVPAASVGAPHIRDRVFVVAHAIGIGRAAGRDVTRPAEVAESVDRGALVDTVGEGRPHGGATDVPPQAARVFDAEPDDAGWWAVEPDVGRVAHGVPGRVDRLRGLGNAVVPQVAEHIGRLVMAAASVGHPPVGGS
jgi:DNA (cytosine-5)-methyltransferase 1